MRALTAHSGTLEIVEAPTPEPGRGQVRIRMEAATVNPVDLATRDGPLAAFYGSRERVGLGWDVAGTIDEIGPGVTNFELGEMVIGVSELEAVRGGGAFAAVVGGTAPTPLRGTHVANVWIRADGAGLAELAALAEAGRLNLRVAGTHPLGEAATAYGRVADGGVRGRVVLVP
ncbi:alcohol dehydrogenase catalytic domain-containing protein [Microtetraspora malaysiensis]|uniref:alcohol dehydrogenase catalytic domain-containing protein n=1 Tax=Microtetraspora malaysiensis TaxID=161358 RepID=UPI00082C4256|nr:zinc-binding dehydrogenase [Microtetraspora malaysiensis]